MILGPCWAGETKEDLQQQSPFRPLKAIHVISTSAFALKGGYREDTIIGEP